ncbi:MAG: peroxiredoxin family protein [Chloroflexi bacterium]|nr:peroxiredoxin family protein [Chloroflexota bacterium]
MPVKLIQGDKLLGVTLKLADGGDLVIPDQMSGRYVALLFYRGNWCPYCVRHLLSYQAKLTELEQIGAQVIAATADTPESSRVLAAERGITFPLLGGVTEETVAGLGALWTDDNHGHYMQPLELLVLRGGTIFGSMYASGPVGRMDVDEVINAIRSRERRRLEQAGRTAEPA